MICPPGFEKLERIDLRFSRSTPLRELAEIFRRFTLLVMLNGKRAGASRLLYMKPTADAGGMTWWWEAEFQIPLKEGDRVTAEMALDRSGVPFVAGANGLTVEARMVFTGRAGRCEVSATTGASGPLLPSEQCPTLDFSTSKTTGN